MSKLTIFVLFATFICAINSLTEGGFHIDGTKLIDAKGNEFIIRGINHAHTWFKNERDTALQAIAETKANSVRLVLADGDQWDADPIDQVRALIEKCKELKMIAILEVHDATGKDKSRDLNNAVSYWISIKDALIGNEAYVIVNIANEWEAKMESRNWEESYINAITLLRMQGIQNTLLIDASGYGQYPQCIVDSGRKVFDSDPLKNTMFATHMYANAGKDEQTVKQNIDNVYNQGLCHIIGEFAHTCEWGDIAEETIMSYCTEKGIGYMPWSWKGNNDPTLDMSNDWEGHDLTEWGDEAVNGPNGIRETSHVCSVFE